MAHKRRINSKTSYGDIFFSTDFLCKIEFSQRGSARCLKMFHLDLPCFCCKCMSRLLARNGQTKSVACRDHVRRKLGLPEFEPKKKTNGGTRRFSPMVAKYVYRLADGTPYLQVHRLADKSGFPQYH